jgi:hypothetical protein
MVNYLIDHPSNTITVMVPFDATGAWLWQTNPPHPRVPLEKGLTEVGVAGFNSSLIARNVAELFSSNCGISHFYEACSIDDVSPFYVSFYFFADKATVLS